MLVRPWRLLALTLGAVATMRAQPSPTTGDARVVLATSGGISLGSYQAGVNWGLVELLRRAQSDSALRALIMQSGMAIPRLVGLSGASAGTINSLMSAIHYCTGGGRIAPEQSLYWRIWVDVGWQQLMPYGSQVRAPEFGLVDRAYFASTLLPRLGAALAEPGRAGCAVEVAASLTRQQAMTEQVFERVSIAVQRHIGTWRLVVDSATRQMALRQASLAVRSDRSIGTQIAMAPLQPTDVIGLPQVFDLARASSAIPLVFAPIELSYYRSGELDSTGICPSSRPQSGSCTAPQRARFVDGGAFDNRPISVADRLLAASRQNEPVRGQTYLHTIFIVPSAARGERPAVLDTIADRIGGSPAAAQMLGNMWGAAGAYELHTYARARAADTARAVAVADTVQVTTRALPIFGETLAHFGAFLARPFREHDFYVGLYDALHFSAERLCGTEAISAIASAEAIRSRVIAESACLSRRFAALTEQIEVGCTARTMLARFYEREHAVRPTLPVSTTRCVESSGDSLRLSMLAAMTEAYGAVRAAPTRCVRTLSAIENSLCSSGLLAFFDSVRAHGLGTDVARYLREHPACGQRSTASDSVRAACFVDVAFQRFLASPPDFLKRLTFAGLERAAAVERAGQRLEGSGFSSGRFSVANAVVRNVIGRPTRRLWEWDRSSVPRECADGNLYPRLGWCGVIQTAFRGLVPYTVAGGRGLFALETGVRPSYHASSRFSLVAPLSLHYGGVNAPAVGARDTSRAAWTSSAGLAMERRSSSILVNSCLTGVARRFDLPDRAQPIDRENRWLFRASCDLIASRFTVGLSSTRLSFDRRSAWTFTFGIADVNGLLYWLVPDEVRTRF
jgi:predicted acylesterase/phospholipase RssA